MEAAVNESKRTSQVLKRFRELYPDGVAWKFNDRIARSRPDAMFARKGQVVFVEFKMPGNDVTPGQHLEMEKLRSCFRVYLAEFRATKIHIRSDYVQDMTIDEFCRFVS